jgi:uncharacterized protein YndB with AHSA1/START domain
MRRTSLGSSCLRWLLPPVDPARSQEGIAMISQLFRKKELTFERSYAAPIAAVWEAWTRPELLRQCGDREDHDPGVRGRPASGRQDLHRDGTGRGHGKYQGTRWPWKGTFTHIEQPQRLVYDARSWTESEQDTAISSTSPSSSSPGTAT